MSTIDHLRQTGRTTRMLQAAEEQIKQGETVTVVFATFLEYQSHKLKHSFLSSRYANVRVFNPKEEGIQKFLVLDPETTFIDHAVIEIHFSDLVFALNRFNLKA